MLTLASVSMHALGGGPSKQSFAQMVLQGITFHVETLEEGSINPVTVRAMSGDVPFTEELIKADGTISGVEVGDLIADGYLEIYLY